MKFEQAVKKDSVRRQEACKERAAIDAEMMKRRNMRISRRLRHQKMMRLSWKQRKTAKTTEARRHEATEQITVAVVCQVFLATNACRF